MSHRFSLNFTDTHELLHKLNLKSLSAYIIMKFIMKYTVVLNLSELGFFFGHGQNGNFST